MSGAPGEGAGLEVAEGSEPAEGPETSEGAGSWPAELLGRLRALWPHVRTLLGVYVIFSLTLGLGLPVVMTLLPNEGIDTRPEMLSPAASRVRFPTPDGYTLAGFFSPPRGAAPMLIVQHGVGTSRDDQILAAGLLARMGYGILMFDWRAHGESDGWVIGFGAHEPNDLLGALAFLEGRPEAAGRPVAVVAESMGAAITSMTAPHLPPSVKCLVLDSPYASLPRLLDAKLWFLGALAPLPRRVLDVTCRLLVGRWPGAVVPERALAAFAPRPILVFHGTADEVIPVAESKSTYALYPGPKQLWITEGDQHVEARFKRIREWMTRVTTFLGAHLEGAPDPGPVLGQLPESVIPE